MLKIRDWIGITIDAIRGIDNAKLARQNEQLKSENEVLKSKRDVHDAGHKIPERNVDDPEREKQRSQDNLERALSPDGKTTTERLSESIKKPKKL